MAKFVYRLENVLEIKMKMEEQAKTAFAEAAAKVSLEQKKLNEMYSRKESYEDSYRRVAIGIIKPVELKYAKDCIDNINRQIKIQTAVLKGAQKSLEVARFKLNEALKERKIHEKLKENAFEVFKQELNDTEKKEIDELVSYRFNNNGKAGVK